MKVRVKTKPLDSNGLQLAVAYGEKDAGKGHRGNLYVARNGLTWCEGKKASKHGKYVTWDIFIHWMEARP